jgi:Ca2+-binding RTX toxin-like protein
MSLSGFGTIVAPRIAHGNSYGQAIEGNDAANTLTLTGMAGDDSLFGYPGNDILIGGLGRDSMRGHSGADRVDFNSVKESVVGAKRDVVNDFQKKIDKIDLSTIDADTDGTAGHQALKWIGSKAFSGVDGQLRFAGASSRVTPTATGRLALRSRSKEPWQPRISSCDEGLDLRYKS